MDKQQPQPQIGEIWTYSPEGRKYKIEGIDITGHTAKLSSDGHHVADKYNLEYFQNTSLWEPPSNPKVANRCPQCETGEIEPGDYLCHKCRYGV